MDPYRFAPPEHVAKLQRKYVAVFHEIGARRVLDLGCGRGIFLSLLRQAGIEGVGVDNNREAVGICREAGFVVLCGDAIGVLEELAAGNQMFDGILCSHLIEHLEGDGPARLIASACRVLARPGRLVVVTPNVENLQVLTEGFWLDLSHVRFVPRLLIETLMRDAELRIVASETDSEAASGWQAAKWPRKLLLRFLLGRTMVDRHLLSGLDAYVIGERVEEALR